MLAAGVIAAVFMALSFGAIVLYWSPAAPASDPGPGGAPAQGPTESGGGGSGGGSGYPWAWPSPGPSAGGGSSAPAPGGGGGSGANDPPPAGPPPTTATTPPAGPNNRPPNTPSDPNPADGATGRPLAFTLKWRGGDPDGAQPTYKVYLGRSTPPTEVPCESVVVEECATGTLEPFTWYWWRVEANDGTANVPGPNWKFQTQQNDSDGIIPTCPPGIQCGDWGG